MRIFRGASALISVSVLSALLFAAPALSQDAPPRPPANIPPPPGATIPADGTAMDAAQAMASAMDGAGGGISSTEQIAALQDAAAAGDPMAQWQLGLMYESGEGVAQDKAKAFGYFAQIADQHADAAPRGTESDIVAHSFVKMGEYYKDGLPEAGIPKDEDQSIKLLMHAASYFGDADAQYRVGEMYLDKNELGDNPIQSARWLSLAAKKGYAPAQAKLGDILFNGSGGLKANPVEGLMWLTARQPPGGRYPRCAVDRGSAQRRHVDGFARPAQAGDRHGRPARGAVRSARQRRVGTGQLARIRSSLRPGRGRWAFPSRALRGAQAHHPADRRPAATAADGRCGCRLGGPSRTS